jgi:hypothetical protein
MIIVTQISEPIASVSCLQKIDQLAIDLEQDLFTHYPAMKLGLDEDVSFYARKLAKVANNIIKKTEDCYDWVLTAPPYNAIPAAANLMSWRVYDLLKESLNSRQQLSIANLRLPKKSMVINNAQEFKTYYEYSNNSIQERIKERTKLQQNSDDIIKHKQDFCTRGVIVINDIKVTGTQQRFMQQSFAQVGPAHLHWLYVFDVDADLGKIDPKIEHRINHSKLQTLNEFIEVICSEKIEYTARCVSRLFAYETTDFEFLLHQLGAKRRALLLDLATREGRYDGDFFSEKIVLLEALCTEDA